MVKHTKIEKTAYHEAGHAVAHYIYKLPYKYVTITPDGDTLGHLHRGSDEDFNPDIDLSLLKNRMFIERQILSYLAGPYAESRFSGRHDWRGAAADKMCAIRLAELTTGSPKQTETYLKQLIVEAKCFVSDPSHWGSIDAVAKALLANGRMSAKEIKKVIIRSAN